MRISHPTPFNAFAALVFAAIAATYAYGVELTLDTTWCNVTDATRIACDTETHLLYVTSPLGQEIVVYGEHGDVVNSITTSGPPGAICLAESGSLIVSIGRAVYKLSTDGDQVLTVGLSEDFFVDPHDVQWTPDGRVYVADDDEFIKVFDGTGNQLFSFGGYGYFNGRFDEPVAMAFNIVTEELIVTDQNNYRIQSFSLDGDSLRLWGSEGNGLYVDGSYFRPYGIDVDGLGQIWTLDILLDLVEVYDSVGNFVFSAALETPNIRGGVDLAVDGDRLFVSSPSTNCIYVYSISGGTTPVNPPLNLTIHWTEESVQLCWNSQIGATTYAIERSSDIDFSFATTEVIGQTADTTFTDVLNDNLFDICYYRVTDNFGAQTPVSGTATLVDPRYSDVINTNHDAPHHVTDGVNCNSCHLRLFDYPNPRPDWWVSDHLCKSCHVETGFAKGVQTHLGADTVACNICHSPHYHQPQFARFFIRNENPVGGSRNMLFNHETDFIHGAPYYDGICEICHTQTDYHRSDSTGDHSHNADSNCLDCHRHENGFMP